MSIPDYQTLMLSLLRLASDGAGVIASKIIFIGGARLVSLTVAPERQRAAVIGVRDIGANSGASGLVWTLAPHRWR